MKEDEEEGRGEGEAGGEEGEEGRGGESEERRLLELVLREPVTPLQALKKTTVEKGREEEEKGEGIEEGEGRKEGGLGGGAENDDSSNSSFVNLSHRYRP